jgi:uncharacterized protein (TIGR01777 family)
VRVAVTGSTGFFGTELCASLRAGGHEVVRVVRSADGVAGPTVRWDPVAGTIEATALEGVDAVVHLAGEPIGPRRWTNERKQRILESRRRGTAVLASALAGLEQKPAVLLSASGVDYYGDTGDEVVTEQHPAGSGYMTDVCVAWEGATQAAADAGIRTALLRSAMVLDPAGGALAKLLPLFKVGLGGRIGTGRQWWSWITLDDWIGAATFLLDHDVSGPVNMASPEPVRNADFAAALGGVLDRPSFIPTPMFGPKLVLGAELATTLLGSSHRVVPAALEKAGHEFGHREITAALRAVLSR